MLKDICTDAEMFKAGTRKIKNEKKAKKKTRKTGKFS
jgi:hypothetical protein